MFFHRRVTRSARDETTSVASSAAPIGANYRLLACGQRDLAIVRVCERASRGLERDGEIYTRNTYAQRASRKVCARAEDTSPWTHSFAQKSPAFYTNNGLEQWFLIRQMRQKVLFSTVIY